MHNQTTNSMTSFLQPRQRFSRALPLQRRFHWSVCISWAVTFQFPIETGNRRGNPRFIVWGPCCRGSYDNPPSLVKAATQEHSTFAKTIPHAVHLTKAIKGQKLHKGLSPNIAESVLAAAKLQA